MHVYLSNDVKFAVEEVIKDLKRIIHVDNNSFLRSEKNKILLKTDIQECINKKYESELKNLIHKIIIEHCFKAENISAGGFFLTLDLISKNIFEEKKIDLDSTFFSKFEDFNSLISRRTDDLTLIDLISQAISLAGFTGKITIEKSSNFYNSVELIEGYTFKHKGTGLKPLRLVKPKIILIDGYIESVSEINMLFEGAVETKEQLLLVCRGMHDDVLNTIKINRDRSSMFIYPIIINFDLDGINTIVDMSVASSCNPVSCHLGELISSVKISDAVQLDEVFIISNSITIKNKKSKKNVNVHVNNLLEKIKSSTQNDVGELLVSRIRSLSGNNVVIRLSDDSTYILKRQFIDNALRSIKSMIDYGVIIQNNQVELNATFQAANELSKKFFSQINNIGAAVC